MTGPTYPPVACPSDSHFSPYAYNCVKNLNVQNLTFVGNEYQCTGGGDPMPYFGPQGIICDDGTLEGETFDNFRYNTSVFENSKDRLDMSFAVCKYTNKNYPKYCEYVANYYALSQYTDGAKYNELFPDDGTYGQYGYPYWPKDVPWVSYVKTLEFIQENDFMKSKFAYQEVVTFVLAVYDSDGGFIGFKQLQRDFNYCGGNQNVTQIWRVFGSNYNNSCNLNINVQLENDPNRFYEPFFLQAGVLKPIPVMITNTGSKKPFRRFFAFRKIPSSATEKVQYASNISIVFQMDPTTGTSVLPAHFEVTYSKISQTMLTSAPYVFSVTYFQSFSSFWKSVIIVAAVFGSLALAYFFFKSYTFIQHFGDDGMDSTVIVGIFGEFLHVLGVVLFFIILVFALYILFFFKWQKSVYMFLPIESELYPFLILQWVAFAAVALSSLIKIIQTTNCDVFIIDWEEQRDKKAPISAWRRLMITNDWIRIFTIRSYYVPLTLVVLVFILTGFNADLMAAPIPTDKLLNTGTTYKVLRFAFTSFVWLLFMLAEWIFTTFIYWNFVGSPFSNFLDLCAISNCSVLMMVSRSYGYYLHGRSIHVNADEDMAKLHNNLATETQGTIGLRGLVPNTNDQVFEIYLHQKFRTAFKETYEVVQSCVKPRTLENEKTFTSASVSHEALASFGRLNKFLQKFIDSVGDYEIKPAPFNQRYLGIAPTVGEKSVFLIENDIAFKNSMFAGIEWTLMLFLLLLFVGIETETNSPPIAAFTTFLIDQIVVTLVRKRGRSNIAKKSLIDNRFILS